MSRDGFPVPRGAALERARMFGRAVFAWRASVPLPRGSAAHRLGVTPDWYDRAEADGIDPLELAPSTALRIQQQTGLSAVALGLAPAAAAQPAGDTIDAERVGTETFGAETIGTGTASAGLTRAGEVVLRIGGREHPLAPTVARLLGADLVRHADLAEA